MISAHVQDSCLRRADMALAAQAEALPGQRDALRLGRRGRGPAERVGSVLRFDRVLKVSHLGLDEARRIAGAQPARRHFREDRSALRHGDARLRRRRDRPARSRVPRSRASRHRPAPPGAGMPRPCADQRRVGLSGAAAELLMAITLDMRAADFEPRFARSLAAKRESAADVDAAVAAIIATCARAATRRWPNIRCASIASTCRARASASRRPRSTRRSRPAIPRRWTRWNSPMSACSPIIAASSRRRLVRRRARRRARLALARRSTRSASMFPAARRAIPRR